MLKSRYLPYVVVGTLVLIIGWRLLTPKRDSELALRHFAKAMFGAEGLGCARLSNGTQLLSDRQSQHILDKIVRPMFTGLQLQAIETERRSDGHSSAKIQARGPDGRPFYLALNAFDLEDGGAVPLFMMLQKCWQAPVISKLGTYPANDAAFDQAYFEGIRRAGPELEAAGLGRIFGPQGKFMSPEDIQAYYEERIAQSHHQ